MKLLQTTIEKIVILILAAFIAVTFVQVLARFIFNSPFMWAEELIRYLFVWFTLLGAGLALNEKMHIGLDYLEKRLNGISRKMLNVTSYVLLIFLFSYITWQGSIIVMKVQDTTSAALDISMAIPYAAIPVGSLLLVIFSISLLGHELKETKKE